MKEIIWRLDARVLVNDDIINGIFSGDLLSRARDNEFLNQIFLRHIHVQGILSEK